MQTYKVRRYHLRSLDSYWNMKDLVQNYIKYLKQTDLIEAWYEKLDYSEETMSSVIRTMLEKNKASDNLIIRDRVAEAWARENDVKIVNEL